ncbi:ABC transporter permease [Companilactobacillus furfuricola]|uniref:ABC transporter permease n=1 Tax=Companilactobacillus furfuricola TaxID=1462575 RepID=UPI000F789FD1|nr:ABC transporter permease [Companilactobacillus furfuricola]
MIELWKERLKRYQLNQFKYLRLIFNDTFVLAFIVLLGALGFWYSNLLDTIHSELWFGKLIVVAILLLTVQAGKLATMMEAPDSTFLLVREKQFYQYFKSAENYSRILPIVFIAVITFLMSPFAVQAAGMNVWDVIFLGAATIFAKMLLLDTQLAGLYGKEKMWGINLPVLMNLVFLALLLLASYSFTWLAPIILLAIWVWFNSKLSSFVDQGHLQWQKAISDEDQRMFRVKRFYNLFTDVPGISSKIKRRKWLDFAVNGIKLKHDNTYLYLFARGVIRNNEYIGLVLRLTILQVILLCLIDNFYISLVVEMLFIYLVGFQLKPYFKEVMQNLMQRLYPVPAKEKVAAFTKISNTMLLIQWFVSIFAVLYKFGLSANSGIIVVAGLVVIGFLNYIYMPHQLRKFLDNGEY